MENEREKAAEKFITTPAHAIVIALMAITIHHDRESLINS